MFVLQSQKQLLLLAKFFAFSAEQAFLIVGAALPRLPFSRVQEDRCYTLHEALLDTQGRLPVSYLLARFLQCNDFFLCRNGIHPFEITNRHRLTPTGIGSHQQASVHTSNIRTDFSHRSLKLQLLWAAPLNLPVT